MAERGEAGTGSWAGRALALKLPSPGPRARRDLQALAYFTLVTLVLLYRVVLNADRFAGDPGDPLLNAWILAWDWHALVAHLPRFFDTNIFFPYAQTLAYSESLLGDLPLVGPLIALTGNPLLATNVLVLVSFIGGGWAMYFLASRLTGSGWAGLIAGSVFAYNLQRFAGYTHLQLLTTQWLPLLLYCLDRMLSRGGWRYWLGAVVCFNLQFLSSYYLGLFTALLVALLVVAYVVAGRSRLTGRLLAQLAAFVVLVAALNLPLARPYFALAHERGLQRTLEDVTTLSAAPLDYLTPVPEHWLYGGVARALDPEGRRGGEHALFLGALGWLLAAAALLWRGGAHRRQVLVFAVVAAALALFSLGPRLGVVPLPYRLLFDYVPGFRGIRLPARLIVLVATMVALLSAFGAAGLLQRLGARRRLLAPALCLLIVAEAGLLRLPGVIVPPPAQGPEVYHWLAAQPGDPVLLELPISTNATLQAYLQSTRQFYSTLHWKRMVNGYSGFLTQAYLTIGATSQNFPDPATIAWLQGLRVDLVLLHRDDYEPAEWERLTAALPRYSAQLRPLEELGETRVLQVTLPEWSAAAERPEFGGLLRLLGYSSAPGKLKLYWQRRAAAAGCRVRLRGEAGAEVVRDLGAERWQFDEVNVLEVALPAELRGWRTLTLTVEGTAGALPIRAGAQTLPGLVLHPLP